MAGLVIALGGVAVVATANSGTNTPEGVRLALLATTAPAAGTVLMRRLRKSIDLLSTTAVQFLLGGAILVALSAVVEPWSAVRWSGAVLSGLVVLGVIGTGLAYLAWFWLLGRVSLVLLGATLFLVPLTGVVVAIVTGDRPSPTQLVGMAATLAGIGLVAADPATRRRRPTADQETMSHRADR